MSFPFEVDNGNTVTSDEYKEPCEYGIDFKTGQLTGKKVYGLEAIKVWIWIALRTPRYRHIIYSWNYGHDLDDLIGKSYTQDYINSEAPRMIEECLLANPHITGITDYSFNFESDKLTGGFTVKTTYGEVETSV